MVPIFEFLKKIWGVITVFLRDITMINTDIILLVPNQVKVTGGNFYYGKYFPQKNVFLMNETCEKTYVLSSSTMENSVPLLRSRPMVPFICSTRENTIRNPRDLVSRQFRSFGIPTPLSRKIIERV